MRAISSILVALLLLSSCVSVQKYNERLQQPIPVSVLKKDVRFIKKKLFAMHPDLDWYISKQQLSGAFDSLERSITQPMYYMQYYFALAPIVAQVKQGHTLISAWSPRFTKEQRTHLKGSTGPFSQVKVFGDQNKWYIIEDNTIDTSLTIGAELLSINGISPQKVVDTFKGVIVGDGFNPAYFDYVTKEKLNLLYSKLLGFQDSLSVVYVKDGAPFQKTILRTYKPESDSIIAFRDSLKDAAVALQATIDSIAYATADSVTQLAILEKDSLNALNDIDTTKEPSFKRKLTFGYNNSTDEWAKDLKIVDSTTAILKLRNFTEGMQKAAYNEIFDSLKQLNISNLIIDVRGNPGGKLADIHYLHGFIASDSIYNTTNKSTTTTSKIKMPFWTAKMMPVWSYPISIPIVIIDGIIYFTKTKSNKDGTYSYRMKQSSSLPIHKDYFKGDIYMLIDGGTFSAASILAANFKSEKRGLVVGTETGGAYNGTVAGKMPVYKRKKTHINFRVGTMNIKPAKMDGEAGRGVTPDETLSLSLSDKLDKKDGPLDYVLQEIKKKEEAKKANTNDISTSSQPHP